MGSGWTKAGQGVRCIPADEKPVLNRTGCSGKPGVWRNRASAGVQAALGGGRHRPSGSPPLPQTVGHQLPPAPLTSPTGRKGTQGSPWRAGRAWTSASTEGVTLRVRCHSAVPSSLLCLLKAGDSPEVLYPKLSSCSQGCFCVNSLFPAEQLSPRMFPGVRSKQGPGLCLSRPGSGGSVRLAQGPENPRASICSSVRWS